MIIKAALRGLRKEDLAPTDVKTAVADIDEEIVRLNRIVTEVLDFAQPIRFDLAVDRTSTRLCADADRASGADGTPLGARMNLDPRLPEVVTDGERVRLVLVNLLTNARHALAGRGRRDPGAISITTDARHRQPRSPSRFPTAAPASALNICRGSSIRTSPPGAPAPGSASPSPATSSKGCAAPSRSAAAPAKARPCGSSFPPADGGSRRHPARRRRGEDPERARVGGPRRRPRRRRGHRSARGAAAARRSACSTCSSSTT